MYSKKLSPVPQYFQDVALLAFPEPQSEAIKLKDFSPYITTSVAVADADNRIDGDTTTDATFPDGLDAKTIFTIVIETKKNFNERSLTLIPAGSPFMAHAPLGAIRLKMLGS